MKLTLKLAVAFVLGISLMLFVYGVTRVRHASALLLKVSKQDHLAVGHTLAVAVAEAWRVNGRSRGLALIELVNHEKRQIAIRWVPRAPGPAAVERPRLTADEWRTLTAGHDLALVQPGSRGDRVLTTYVPVRAQGDIHGAIELTAPLSDERQYVEVIIRRTTLTGVLIAGLCAVMSVALGYFMVGRPVKRLTRMARRVGAGDFAGRLPRGPRDELGGLAVEVNAMIQRLAETSSKLSAETRSRIAAIEQLRHAERLTTVGQLASGVAHELGTPLQVISGRAKLMVREELPAPEAKESAGIIVEQTERITRIIRQLLDFARRRSPQKARRDLVPIIQSSLALLDPMAARQGIALSLEKSSAAFELELDAGQIQQVLTNLLVNGIQAMPAGGTLRVVLRERRIQPPADHGGLEGEYVCIEVLDEGSGIPEEDLHRVFEPFFTTKQIGEGTGLGLSVSYGIVREHGGWIDATSEPGQGSCFTVCLPRGAQGHG
jgi:two-component system, NtrC family, sensor kinase